MSHSIPPLHEFAECYVFAKQSPGPFNCGSQGHCRQNPGEHPFSRSYGVILPSSLTWFLSRTLVCSTRPPVSVCGTACGIVNRRAFLGGMVRAPSRGIAAALRVTVELASARLHPNYQSWARLAFRVTRRHVPKFRNVRLMSIGYALGPRLRDRLTLGGRTWPRKPRTCGGGDSRPPCRYSCLHGLRETLQSRSRSSFGGFPALSYQSLY